MTMRRGKILKIRFGVNPNSSSIGLDVQVLVLSSAVISMLVAGVSMLVRVLRRNPDRNKPAGS